MLNDDRTNRGGVGRAEELQAAELGWAADYLFRTNRRHLSSVRRAAPELEFTSGPGGVRTQADDRPRASLT
jgi:hypothetical protein